MARAFNTLMTKEEEKEIGQVFALIRNNVVNIDQNKKHGDIYDKTKDIEVEVIEEDLYDDMEYEVQ